MNQLKIKQIEIQNFRSIQDKTVLNIKPGLISIEGINMDEGGNTFNGAGKSSIVSALYWCLTGNALTNEVLADEIVNSKVGKNCHVSVLIESNQGDVKITRYRKDSDFSNDLQLEIAGQNVSCHKVADTQERINQILKIPFELLHSTIIMTHDIKSAFSDLTPQQRIHTLESIRDYSVWDKVRDEANKDIKTYNKEIQELNLSKSNLEGQLSTYMNLVNSDTNKLNTLIKESDVTNVTNKLKDKQNILTYNNQELDKVTLELTGLKAEPMVQDDSLQSKLDKIVDEANQIKADVLKLEYAEKDINRELDTINKWFTNDKCPTCHRLLDRTEEEIKNKQEEKEKYTCMLSDNKSQYEAKQQELSNKRKEWSELNTSLQSQKNIIKDRVSKIQLLESKQTDLRKDNDKLNADIQVLSQQTDRVQQEKNKLEENIRQYNKEIIIIQEQVKEINKNIDTYTNKKQLSDYFYKLLGSKGELRPYLLNKDIQYLNACMQKYIIKFFKNTDVELKLNGAAIDININSNGIKKMVSSLSGGEKKRLNLAIQFALYDLLQSTSQISFNMLWLDEIESELDPQGIQQLIEVIEDMSEKCETVMWITNNTSVKENISSKIICKKVLGKTTIEEQ